MEGIIQTNEKPWYYWPALLLVNGLTIGRLVLTGVIVYLHFTSLPEKGGWYLGLMIGMWLTDLEGQLARRLGVTTEFGKVADQTFDKVVTISLLASFYITDWASVSPVIAILSREVFVSVYRKWYYRRHRRILGSELSGKVKLWILAIYTCIIALIYTQIEGIEDYRRLMADTLLWVAATTSWLSAWDFRKKVGDGK